MKKAWEEIERLIKVGAIHRKGFCITDVKPAFILCQAEDELAELVGAPNDPEELGDLLGILLHYAIKQGWTLDQLEGLMLSKFAKRFWRTIAGVEE